MSISTFLGIVAGYVGIVFVTGLVPVFLLGSLELGEIETTKQALAQLVVPTAISGAFVYGIVARFRWWKPVFVDDRPVRRWVRIVPALIALSIVAGINYRGLAEEGIVFTLVLLLGALLAGFAEEGMFRGVGVAVFRLNGYREGMVALWTSVIFGAAHFVTGLTTGALAQAFAVTLTGYFFYLTRRVTGGNAVNSVLHGLYVFALLSAFVGRDDDVYAGAASVLVVYVALAVVVLVGGRRIEPASIRADRPDVA